MPRNDGCTAGCKVRKARRIRVTTIDADILVPLIRGFLPDTSINEWFGPNLAFMAQCRLPMMVWPSFESAEDNRTAWTTCSVASNAPTRSVLHGFPGK